MGGGNRGRGTTGVWEQHALDRAGRCLGCSHQQNTQGGEALGMIHGVLRHEEQQQKQAGGRQLALLRRLRCGSCTAAACAPLVGNGVLHRHSGHHLRAGKEGERNRRAGLARQRRSRGCPARPASASACAAGEARGWFPLQLASPAPLHPLPLLLVLPTSCPASICPTHVCVSNLHRRGLL